VLSNHDVARHVPERRRGLVHHLHADRDVTEQIALE